MRRRRRRKHLTVKENQIARKTPSSPLSEVEEKKKKGFLKTLIL